MEDEFTRYVAEVEKQADITLVIKANVLKRRQTDLKTEVKDLQDQIEAKRPKLSYFFNSGFIFKLMFLPLSIKHTSFSENFASDCS